MSPKVDKPLLVCDSWLVRRQTHGYLPSRRTSPSLDRYCLVTEAHVCEQLAQGCYLKAQRPNLETVESRVQCPYQVAVAEWLVRPTAV